MKTNKLFFKGFLITLCTGVLLSCNKEELIENETIEALDDSSIFAKSLIPLFPGHSDAFFNNTTVTPIDSEGETTTQTTENPDGTVSVCTIKPREKAQNIDDFPPLGDSQINEKLFPGALVTGASVADPVVVIPNNISMPRAGGIISILGLAGGFNEDNNGNSIAEPIPEVTQSNVATAINRIINRKQDKSLTSDLEFTFRQIESKEQLAFNLGVTVAAFGANLESSLSFSTDKQYNRALVRLEQTYFKMKIQEPNSREEIFPDTVTEQDILDHFSPDNLPAYVSSVDYGRVFFMLIESTESKQEMEAAIRASLDRTIFNGSVEAEIKEVSELKDLNVQAYAFGGDARGTLSLVGETDLQKIVDGLAAAADITNGVPISYTVRSLFNPSNIVKKGLSVNFNEVSCRNVGNIPAGYAGLVGLFEDGIGAMARMKESTLLIYNMAGDKYTFYNVALGRLVDGIIYTHNDPNGPLGVSPLNNVGAAYLSLHRNDNNKIFLFDRESGGLEVARMDFDKNKLGSLLSEVPTDIGAHYPANKNTPISTFFSQEFNGTSPIGSDGIDAAMSFEKLYPRDQYFFAYSNGSRATTTQGRINDDPRFNPNYPLYDVSGSSFNTIYGFENIGAAALIRVSGETEFIRINLDGTQLIFSKKGRKEGPFTIN